MCGSMRERLIPVIFSTVYFEQEFHARATNERLIKRPGVTRD